MGLEAQRYAGPEADAARREARATLGRFLSAECGKPGPRTSVRGSVRPSEISRCNRLGFRLQLAAAFHRFHHGRFVDVVEFSADWNPHADARHTHA